MSSSPFDAFCSSTNLLIEIDTPPGKRSGGSLNNDPETEEGWNGSTHQPPEPYRRTSNSNELFIPDNFDQSPDGDGSGGPDSDSTDAGAELSEGQDEDAMSPSLSSTCADMNGTSVETKVQQALAEQALMYQARLAEKDSRVKELEAQLANLALANDQPGGPPRDDSLIRVLAEYEETMAAYIQQIDELTKKIEESDQEKLRHLKERDQALEDLTNVETAFSDVHRKYERAKSILENNRKNEELLKQRDMQMLEKISNREARMEELKEQVKANLEQMHGNYEAKQRALETDVVRLRAQLRKSEMRVDTLVHDVEQKSREVTKLNTLCDELINEKVK